MFTPLLDWLLNFRYLMLFLGALIEGPVVTLVAGSLAGSGEMQFMIAYPIIIAGDVTADSLWYLLGRFGRNSVLERYGRFVGLPPERIDRIDRHFAAHAGKTLILGKLAFTIELPFIVVAGIARVPYPSFLGYMVTAAIPKTLLLLLIGYFLGFSLVGARHDVFYIARVVLVVAITAWVLTLAHGAILKWAKRSRHPNASAYLRVYNRLVRRHNSKD